ncbi:glycosyltransferase [Altericroceibacterium spongiae]|uniref:Glycosyltransferase n=1 Tax=Altericroceibacterium spongiae TaxID=2320269 RepID=A0A420E9C9_9SPHN|nr:glycosyltransferase [Altericroceibacterium spongiae]RKF15971.1 glycosyltransferase [Altericroceibacterium spongiae]
MAKQIFIAWIDFQRRAESMKSYFGFDLHYICKPFNNPWLKVPSYIGMAWKTISLIRKSKADVVWIQMPPTFLLHILALNRFIGGRRLTIIADCHNRVFRPPWSQVPGLIGQLNNIDVALAHNAEVYQTAIDFGVDPAKLMVFETRPAQLVRPNSMPAPPEVPEILVPCSYNPDEPISTLLEAARQSPDIRFLLTGKVAKAKAKGFVDAAPENVIFTGFLDKDAYERLLFGCTAILGLTELEGIQLSVANEAVGAGKAMVLSDTAILRELFGSAALFAKNEPNALAAACREAIASASELNARSATLREARELRWEAQAEAVKAKANLLHTTASASHAQSESTIA